MLFTKNENILEGFNPWRIYQSILEKTPLIPKVNIDPRERKWGILNAVKVSYKHSESAYWKASIEVLISSKYHRRYKNNGDFGN